MKKLKYAMFVFVATAVLSANPGVAMATGYQTPAEVAAAVTGRTVEDVVQERDETGKTYGEIADEAGKLNEFKKETFKMKKRVLNQKVKDGILSQEEADQILENIEERQSVCNGTGYGQGAGCGYGRGVGAGFGNGNRNAQGNGNGPQRGFGRGRCK